MKKISAWFRMTILLLIPAAAIAKFEIQEPAVSGIKHDRVTLEWTTSEKSFGAVHYGETQKFGKKIADPSFSKEHRIQIRGLKAETLYYFKIEGWPSPPSPKDKKEKKETDLYKIGRASCRERV